MAHFYVAPKQIILRSAEVDDVNVFDKRDRYYTGCLRRMQQFMQMLDKLLSFAFLCVWRSLFINMGPLNCFDY